MFWAAHFTINQKEKKALAMMFIGLIQIGINMKMLPLSAIAAAFVILFPLVGMLKRI